MLRYRACVLAAAVLAAPSAAAENKFDAEACARAVAPYLDERTFAVLHVDLTAVDVDALLAKQAALSGMEGGFPKDPADTVKALTAAGARDLYVVASLADLPERPPFAVLPLVKDAKVKELTAELERSHSFDVPHFERIGEALVGGDEATLKRLRSLKPTARPELAPALAVAGEAPVRLAVLPPTEAAKVIDAVMPTLPAEVGGGSSKVLAHGLRWAALGLDGPPLKLRLIVQAADAEAAQGLLDLLRKTYAAVGQSREAREFVPRFDELKELLTPKVAGDRLTLTLDDRALTTTLRPLFTIAREDAEKEQISAHLRQLAVAALNYEAAHGTYPPAAIYDKDGKPLLSWRVRLLPYLGEEKLYKEFHLDEPWDGEHNKKLVARMPEVFRSYPSPKLWSEGRTTYLAPVGDATMFPPGRGVRIAEVTDGTSATILFVDADADYATVWTKPDDLEYDAKEPWKGLGFRYPGGAVVAFADGSAHLIPKTIEKATLQALFTRNGGEVVTPP